MSDPVLAEPTVNSHLAVMVSSIVVNNATLADTHPLVLKTNLTAELIVPSTFAVMESRKVMNNAILELKTESLPLDATSSAICTAVTDSWKETNNATMELLTLTLPMSAEPTADSPLAEMESEMTVRLAMKEPPLPGPTFADLTVACLDAVMESLILSTASNAMVAPTAMVSANSSAVTEFSMPERNVILELTPTLDVTESAEPTANSPLVVMEFLILLSVRNVKEPLAAPTASSFAETELSRLVSNAIKEPSMTTLFPAAAEPTAETHTAVMVFWTLVKSVTLEPTLLTAELTASFLDVAMASKMLRNNAMTETSLTVMDVLTLAGRNAEMDDETEMSSVTTELPMLTSPTNADLTVLFLDVVMELLMMVNNVTDLLLTAEPTVPFPTVVMELLMLPSVNDVMPELLTLTTKSTDALPLVLPTLADLAAPLEELPISLLPSKLSLPLLSFDTLVL